MLHMIKLCVGISSVDELEHYRQSRCVKIAGQNGEFHLHRTRMRPKRREEIVGQGSLYWVIKGAIRCRQSIVDLAQEVDEEGRNCCDIIMKPQLIRTIPNPKRAFQGWRYLADGDAPGDLGEGDGNRNDAELAVELAALGLI
ncbi:MAG: DUF1489 domain-containing protein [Devosiaceae bacterium]|nr:DUF1489 domain-containing protein [Devosiaceae bacterium]